MKNFFKDLNNLLETGCFAALTKPSKRTTFGDKLAEEIYLQIFNHKLQVVGDKIKAYYEAFQGVDLPEFLKPECERVDVKVKNHLNDLVNQGKLDYFYQLAMQEDL